MWTECYGFLSVSLKGSGWKDATVIKMGNAFSSRRKVPVSQRHDLTDTALIAGKVTTN